MGYIEPMETADGEKTFVFDNQMTGQVSGALSALSFLSSLCSSSPLSWCVL